MSRTVNWNALSKRIVSSTERPTGRSLTVICLGNDVNGDFLRRKDANLRVPLGSIMNKPRKAMPASSSKTPYSREICIFLSAMRGRARSGPRPPCFLGCEAQAKWEYCESVETPNKTGQGYSRKTRESLPKTTVLSSLKVDRESLKARISL